MKRYGWPATLVLVAACLGPRSDPSAFYLLNATVAPVQAPALPVVLGVGPVTLPGYLDRPQLVVRVSENEIALAESDRWAERLDDNVVRILQADLGAPHVLGARREHGPKADVGGSFGHRRVDLLQGVGRAPPQSRSGPGAVVLPQVTAVSQPHVIVDQHGYAQVQTLDGGRDPRSAPSLAAKLHTACAGFGQHTSLRADVAEGRVRHPVQASHRRAGSIRP